MITTSTTDSPPNGPVIPVKPYALAGDVVLDQLRSSRLGLSTQEAEQRQAVFGPNRLPEAAKAGMARIFFRQFLNPLIYILVVAGIASLLVGKFTDAGFIIIVLLLNAIIGTIQEFSAQQSAAALQKIVTRLARVIRSGEAYELNADMLVPGDLVLLESGDKVPADIRLLETHGLEIDESLLSGESLPVLKDAHQVVNIDATMPEQFNMVYGGSIVTRGRARGIVTATGMQTELGRIAEEVLGQSGVKPPLLLRMELFTFRIAWMMGIMVILLGLISFLRGTALTEVMLVGAALAVAAIPEGLPVAMTVALSISMRRMAKRNVIVRRLVAVESLGSCTYIASDKTGTLTVNELTVREFVLPSGQVVELTGIGMSPEGDQD
ncbi:MAG: HAD-IC family P-type ATPase, partial [Gammaproteobacteria bacterium]|nr:HAD-IC family P-type ATPase [Gammaproteobacteria bacterium]